MKPMGDAWPVVSWAGADPDTICDGFTPAKGGVPSGGSVYHLKFLHVGLKL